MLAVMIGAILSVIIIMVIALTLGAAYALTTYVTLPGFVDTLIWIAAGGYSLLSLLGVFIALAEVASAKPAIPAMSRRVRGRRLS